jgi:hypothetical protein
LTQQRFRSLDDGAGFDDVCSMEAANVNVSAEGAVNDDGNEAWELMF